MLHQLRGLVVVVFLETSLELARLLRGFTETRIGRRITTAAQGLML